MADDRSIQSSGDKHSLSPLYFTDSCDFPEYCSLNPLAFWHLEELPFSHESGLFFDLATSSNSTVPHTPPLHTLPTCQDLKLNNLTHFAHHHSIARHKNISKTRGNTSPTLTPVKSKPKGCGCTTSHCLRRYCKCFAVPGYCTDDCGCVDCFNTAEYQEERQEVIKKTEEICKASFAPKIVQIDSGESINPEGCKCKSGCNSKFCLCFRNGVGCSPICKCSSCVNKKVVMEHDQVRKHFRKPMRTKEKIVISLGLNNSSTMKTDISVSDISPKQTTVFVFNKANAETKISQSLATSRLSN